MTKKIFARPFEIITSQQYIKRFLLTISNVEMGETYVGDWVWEAINEFEGNIYFPNISQNPLIVTEQEIHSIFEDDQAFLLIVKYILYGTIPSVSKMKNDEILMILFLDIALQIKKRRLWSRIVPPSISMEQQNPNSPQKD